MRSPEGAPIYYNKDDNASGQADGTREELDSNSKGYHLADPRRVEGGLTTVVEGLPIFVTGSTIEELLQGADDAISLYLAPQTQITQED